MESTRSEFKYAYHGAGNAFRGIIKDPLGLLPENAPLPLLIASGAADRAHRGFNMPGAEISVRVPVGGTPYKAWCMASIKFSYKITFHTHWERPPEEDHGPDTRYDDGWIRVMDWSGPPTAHRIYWEQAEITIAGI